MATQAQGERLARLEGAYEHLATKADLESLRSELHSMMWRLVGVIGLATAVILGAMRLWL